MNLIFPQTNIQIRCYCGFSLPQYALYPTMSRGKSKLLLCRDKMVINPEYTQKKSRNFTDGTVPSYSNVWSDRPSPPDPCDKTPVLKVNHTYICAQLQIYLLFILVYCISESKTVDELPDNINTAHFTYTHTFSVENSNRICIFREIWSRNLLERGGNKKTISLMIINLMTFLIFPWHEEHQIAVSIFSYC